MSVDRTLSGVGVGPGDPDHVTVKALRALEAAVVIHSRSTILFGFIYPHVVD